MLNLIFSKFHSHCVCVMGKKQLADVMTLWDIGKQCIPIPEASSCGVPEELIAVKMSDRRGV